MRKTYKTYRESGCPRFDVGDLITGLYIKGFFEITKVTRRWWNKDKSAIITGEFTENCDEEVWPIYDTVKRFKDDGTPIKGLANYQAGGPSLMFGDYVAHDRMEKFKKIVEQYS